MEKVANNSNITQNSEEIKEVSLPRYLAVKILSRYDRSDSYVDKLITNNFRNENLNNLDKGLLIELVNGVIRWRAKLDWVLTGFYFGDYQKCLNVVKNAMRIGLYQLLYLDKIPAHASINESVEIVKQIQGEKTAGIVNGVLRNISRNINGIRYPDPKQDDVYYLSIMHSHPKWMVKRYIERFGKKETQELLEINNYKPYVPVRVNSLKSNFEEIKAIFDELEIDFWYTKYQKNSLLLKNPRIDLSGLDIFKEGKITIQDPSASLAVELANPKPGMKVLDLCAAPGGKSIYLAELMKNEGEILSLDIHESKLKFIKENSERLGFDIIKTGTGDATKYKSEEKFDIVFVDAPCTGLGTLSKKPDIKWKKEIEDIKYLSKVQRDILRNAAELVKAGGILVYSTCTIEPEENTENIEWFLNEQPDFYIDPADLYIPDETTLDGYMQTLPHIHKMDGAFAARLIKK